MHSTWEFGHSRILDDLDEDENENGKNKKSRVPRLKMDQEDSFAGTFRSIDAQEKNKAKNMKLEDIIKSLQSKQTISEIDEQGQQNLKLDKKQLAELLMRVRDDVVNQAANP